MVSEEARVLSCNYILYVSLFIYFVSISGVSVFSQ